MTQATVIRDAIFARVKILTPTGYSAWGSTSVVSLPTLNTTMLPALQVVRFNETMNPDGQAGMGHVRFIADATIAISVLRGMDDPAVLDGQADADIDAILHALLDDPDFVSPNKFFRGVTRLIIDPQSIVQMAETYLSELRLRMFFDYSEAFGPVPTVPLQSVVVSVGMYSNNLIRTPAAAAIALSGSVA